MTWSKSHRPLRFHFDHFVHISRHFFHYFHGFPHRLGRKTPVGTTPRLPRTRPKCPRPAAGIPPGHAMCHVPLIEIPSKFTTVDISRSLPLIEMFDPNSCQSMSYSFRSLPNNPGHDSTRLQTRKTITELQLLHRCVPFRPFQDIFCDF